MENIKILRNGAVIEWIDMVSANLDMYEVIRNEYLADPEQMPKTLYLYRDILLPFVENTLLLDNIAASEGINFDKETKLNKLKIKVFLRNKDSKENKTTSQDYTELQAEYPDLKAFDSSNDRVISYPDNFPYLLTHKKAVKEDETEGIEILEEAYNNKKITHDIEVCVRSAHSFYSILENFVRNSAKHNKERIRAEGLIITIRIEDKNDDFYKIILHDNCSELNYKKLQDLNSSISDDLLDLDGKPNKKALGIKDMKINAFLLSRKEELNEVGIKNALQLLQCTCDEKTEFPCLSNELEMLNNQNATYRFGYTFDMSKPKKIAWIGSTDNLDKAELIRSGCVFYESIYDFEDKKNKSLASFDFVVLSPKIAESILDKDKWNMLLLDFPFRVLINSLNSESSLLLKLQEERKIQFVEKIIELDGQNKIADLQKECWENWLRFWLNKEENGRGRNKTKAKVFLYFEDEIVIDNWKNNFKSTIDKELLEIVFIKKSDAAESYIASEDTFNIFYDHHGNGLSKCNIQGAQLFGDNATYFQFDKSSNDFATLFYPPNNSEQKDLLIYRMAEAGLCRILIADERIIDDMEDFDTQADKISDKSIKRGDYMLKADLMNASGVFYVNKVGDKIIKSGNNVMDNVVIEDVAYNIKPFKDTLKGWDFVILHRTYIPDTEEKRAIFFKSISKQVPHIIITSGGGKPHSMTHKVRFVPFSSINVHFNKYVSKISLINMI
jgi:hypothetical protein